MEAKDDELLTNFGATRCSIWGLELVRKGQHWAPLGTAGHCWAPLGTAGHHWAPLGTSGHRWAPLSTAGRRCGCWVQLGTFVLILQLVAGNH